MAINIPITYISWFTCPHLGHSRSLCPCPSPCCSGKEQVGQNCPQAPKWWNLRLCEQGAGSAVLSRGSAWWAAHPDELCSVTEVNQYPSVIYAHSDTLTHGRVSTLTLFHCGEMLLIWDFFIVKILFLFGKDTYTNLLFFFILSQIFYQSQNQVQK